MVFEKIGRNGNKIGARINGFTIDRSLFLGTSTSANQLDPERSDDPRVFDPVDPIQDPRCMKVVPNVARV